MAMATSKKKAGAPAKAAAAGYGGGGGTAGRPAVIKAKTHSVQNLTINVPVDEERAAQIQRCIKKGALKISFDQVDLTTGRLGDGWLYD
jgi:hypothetical protein